MTHEAPVRRPGGRTARTTRAVLDATIALLTTETPSDLTVARIAAQAGVNEATIYRKWGTKDALLRDVLLTLSAELLTTPDTGSLRSDLIETVDAVANFLRTPAGYALATLAAGADDATSAVLRDAFWTDRFARAERIFERALTRGEITEIPKALLAYEAMIGALHFRILARRSTLEPEIAERLTDLMLTGIQSENRP